MQKVRSLTPGFRKKRFRAFGPNHPHPEIDFADVCAPFPRQGGPPEKKVPLGIRLKSTRPSHGRFYSFYIPALYPTGSHANFATSGALRGAGLSSRARVGPPARCFAPCQSRQPHAAPATSGDAVAVSKRYARSPAPLPPTCVSCLDFRSCLLLSSSRLWSGGDESSSLQTFSQHMQR